MAGLGHTLLSLDDRMLAGCEGLDWFGQIVHCGYLHPTDLPSVGAPIRAVNIPVEGVTYQGEGGTPA
jgi:hypothetical protein